jgi:phosphoribosyl 1,2-cyclic phosphodiesterase
MRFSSLGSGSDGNSLLIASTSGATSTHVMLDCGFAIKEVERRLLRIGLDARQLSGIIVTHEHSDHIGGVFKLARRYGVPVWLTHGTFEAAARDEMAGVDIRLCRDGETFAIGDLALTPYTVPHDAREPVQYLASDGKRKLGILTDVGQSTPHVMNALSACDALLLEFNHDSEMLNRSAYPSWLKSRIAGPLGHLSNAASAELLAALDNSRLRTLVAAHLSQKNNTPQLARQAIDSVIGAQAIDIVIAAQDEGFGWIDC